MSTKKSLRVRARNPVANEKDTQLPKGDELYANKFVELVKLIFEAVKDGKQEAASQETGEVEAAQTEGVGGGHNQGNGGTSSHNPTGTAR